MDEQAEIYVGDVGTAFRRIMKDEQGQVLAVTAGAVKLIKFKKPDGTVLEKAASLVTDGSDGRIEAVSAEGDLDQAGRWHWQPFVEQGGSRYHGRKLYFEVVAPLSPAA